MQKFKTLATSRVAMFVGGVMLALLMAWPLMGAAQDKSDKEKEPAPQAQHKDKQSAGDKDLADQVRELQAKITKLEAALEKSQHAKSSDMPGMGDKKKGMEGDKMMGGMSDKKKGMEDDKAAMGGSATGMDQEMMQMMQMMQQMMQMKMKIMDKGMGSGMPDTKGKDMGTKGMEMGTKGKDMGAKGMEMGMKGMEMPGTKGMEMMGGKGMAGMQTPSALPGFPGASHIYHIGATSFFLDHPDHIKLTTEQQTALNQAKEKGLLEQSSFQRKIDDAEQDVWTLTSSDKPDATKIDAKVREIEKLRGDQRLAFIRAVGEAAKVLTDDQRKALLGIGDGKSDKPDPHADHKTP